MPAASPVSGILAANQAAGEDTGGDDWRINKSRNCYDFGTKCWQPILRAVYRGKIDLLWGLERGFIASHSDADRSHEALLCFAPFHPSERRLVGIVFARIEYLPWKALRALRAAAARARSYFHPSHRSRQSDRRVHPFVWRRSLPPLVSSGRAKHPYRPRCSRS